MVQYNMQGKQEDSGKDEVKWIGSCREVIVSLNHEEEKAYIWVELSVEIDS
jgi:hypothetical protein